MNNVLNSIYLSSIYHVSSNDPFNPIVFLPILYDKVKVLRQYMNGPIYFFFLIYLISSTGK